MDFKNQNLYQNGKNNFFLLLKCAFENLNWYFLNQANYSYYTKAFDTVKHKCMLTALENQEIKRGYLEIIRDTVCMKNKKLL